VRITIGHRNRPNRMPEFNSKTSRHCRDMSVFSKSYTACPPINDLNVSYPAQATTNEPARTLPPRIHVLAAEGLC
jgi:hypothetical protein